LTDLIAPVEEIENSQEPLDLSEEDEPEPDNEFI
jgi:hypothetical protein